MAQSNKKTPWWDNPRIERNASVVLVIVYVLAFLVFISSRIVANDLMEEAFYINALAENDIYNRVYTELLADPEMQDVSNDLLGNLNLDPATSEDVSSYAVSTLRLVLPPETLKSAVEGAITTLVMYLRGDVDRYEASLNLSSALDDPELADRIVLYARTLVVELLVVWQDTAPLSFDTGPATDAEINAFAAELEGFAQNLTEGDLSELPDTSVFIDISRIPPQKRGVLVDALLAPVSDTIPESIRDQIRADLLAGELINAISMASGELLRPHIQRTVDQLRSQTEDDLVNGIEAVAERADSSEEKIVGQVNTVRDVITRLRHGWTVPLSGLIIVLALAGLGWLHADKPRRLLRVVGGTLILGSLLGIALWWGVGRLVTTPFENYVDPQQYPSLPDSLQAMLADVINTLSAEMGRAIWERTGLVLVVGVGLFFLSLIRIVSRRVQDALDEIAALLRRLTRVSPERLRGAVAMVIALLTLGPVALDTLFTDDTTVIAGPLDCNGHVTLCDRPFNEVVFPATHNSMSVAKEGWLWPSQDGTITDQLNFGMRGFLIDTHYWDTIAQIEQYNDQVPVEVILALLNAIGGITNLDDQLKREGTYVCHGLCVLGADPLVDVLGEMAAFLKAHPREVIVLVIQDAITPEDTETAFRESGLLDLVYTPTEGAPWPTLGEMIEQNTRVVVMAEDEGPPPPWYLHAWDTMQENPYTIRSINEFSCDPNRGGTGKPLFQLNHWIDRVAPSRVDATIVNEYTFLLGWTRECQTRRGQIPNLIVVNFYSLGDLRAVVDTLNGIEQE